MNPITVKCPRCGEDVQLTLILRYVSMDSAGIAVTWGESRAPHQCPTDPDPTTDRVR